MGIAPLKTRKSIVGRYVEFIHPPWCSEFIFDEQHRKTCIEHTLDYLFNTINCKYVSFVLPGDSPDIALLKQQCKFRRIHRKDTSEMGRRIIPLTSTWEEYEAKSARNFRKELRRAMRNLNKLGSWTTKRLEGKEQSTITKKLFVVEEKSWKEKARAPIGETDWTLTAILRAAQQLTDARAPDFKWNVQFLEIEGKTLSYALVIEFREVAYIVKTSFDEDYKKYYPGILIQDSAIHELIDERQNRYIDFLSDLPYLEAWTTMYFPRTKIQLTKGTIPTIIQSILRNAIIYSFVNRIYNWINSASR